MLGHPWAGRHSPNLLPVVLAAALALTPGLLASPGLAADWPQFRADELHAGASPDAVTETSPQVWWRLATTGPVEAGPVVADGRVFVGGTDGILRAVDLVLGRELWRFDAQAPIVASPAVASGVVYLLTKAGTLHALDAATGLPRPVGGRGDPDPGPSIASPTLHEGRLFVATEAGSLLAYNLVTLTQDWSYVPTQEREAVVTGMTGPNATVPVYGCASRGLVAKPLRSAPAVFDGKVFVGSDAHLVHVVLEGGLGGPDAGKTAGAWPANGTQGAACRQALHPALGDVVRAAPAIDLQNRLLVVAGFDDTVRGYRVEDGALRWNHTIHWAGKDSRVIAAPAVTGGVAYVASFNGRLYALQATTTAPFVVEQWNHTAGAPIWSSPAVASNAVVFGADDGALHAVNRTTGAGLWRVDLGAPIRAAPALAGGVVVVGTSAGEVVALGGERPPLPDLFVAGLVLPPGDLVHDTEVQVAVDVWNLGTLAAPATTLRVTHVPAANASNVTTLATLPVPPLGPGSNRTFHLPWRVPADNGTHRLHAVVDPEQLVGEVDRSNNAAASKPLTPVPPPPPPPSVEADPLAGWDEVDASDPSRAVVLELGEPEVGQADDTGEADAAKGGGFRLFGLGLPVLLAPVALAGLAGGVWVARQRGLGPFAPKDDGEGDYDDEDDVEALVDDDEAWADEYAEGR